MGGLPPVRRLDARNHRGSQSGGGVDPTDGLLADEHPDPRTDLIDPF